MAPELKRAFDAEIAAAALARDYEQALHHLSRAHILGQRDTVAHVRVHWLMLKAGFAARDRRETLGQAVRIVAAALFSRLWVPAGNSGRANVSAILPMPIPEDLQPLMRQDGSVNGAG